MRHFENLTNQQVAQALGLQESAATMRYSRALYRLRLALSKEGYVGDSTL
jgi:RNA polymerase sigma-70 factor (ECF subfamily)